MLKLMVVLVCVPFLRSNFVGMKTMTLYRTLYRTVVIVIVVVLALPLVPVAAQDGRGQQITVGDIVTGQLSAQNFSAS